MKPLCARAIASANVTANAHANAVANAHANVTANAIATVLVPANTAAQGELPC